MEVREEPSLCLWQTEREHFIGIIGAGPGFRSIVEIFTSPLYQEFMPVIHLAALAEPDFHQSKVEELRSRGVKVFATAEEMLAACPELDILVELGGKPHRRKELRDKLPARISLIDQNGAIFLCGLHTMHQVGRFRQASVERQKALIQTLIDEIPDEILVMDLAGAVQDVNKSILSRLGKTKEDMLGRPCHQVYDLCDQPEGCAAGESSCPYHATRRTGQRAEALSTRVDQGGRLQYFRIYAYPILDQTGRLGHVLVMRRDITARTSKERQQQQVEKLTVIGEMSTYLAHEIRNPLMAIAGFANALMRSESLASKDRDKLAIIHDEAQRLDHMLTSILNFAKPTATHTGSADVNRLAGETVELMRIGYAQQAIAFDLQLDPMLPRCHGEPELLKQCLVNLLKNAVEAMPESGGRVVVRSALRQGQVALEVADTGRGMSDKEMAQAFSPFFSTKHAGYGLGLAMIRKIMEELGGRVEMQSKPGEGSTVTLLLPAVLAVEESAARGVGPV